jgi:hypothetical protein
VWVAADGGVEMRDEDELEAAVDQRRYTAAEGQQIQEDAQAALRTLRMGGFPFNEPWPDWRPDPTWERPVLPADATREFDQLNA